MKERREAGKERALELPGKKKRIAQITQAIRNSVSHTTKGAEFQN